MANFVDDRHALYCGWILGLGMKHGLPFVPEIDADDNYTDHVVLRVAEDVSITLVVPYPPKGWRFL